MLTYLLWREQCHADGDPAALACSKDEDLAGDFQCIQYLEIHDGSVPVGEVLRLGPGLAMSEKFNGDQVHGIGEILVGILAAVQLRAGCEAVDENKSGLGGVVRLRHLISRIDAAEMGNVDSFGVGHD